MVVISDSKDCCGCTACASVCAHDAIKMEPDSLGFLYPKVDESRCVECGLCEKVCQFNDKYDCSLNLETPIAYAARHKEMDEILKSRSGAAFVAISDYILEQGGIVYGAGYKDHFRVVHKRATTKEERDEFRCSKYVQSDLTGIFRLVREDLKNGLIVLFSGTPCQTSGLRSFLGKKLIGKLVLVDIVCHGAPSPYIWKDYLGYMEYLYNTTFDVINFRDKEKYGWKDHKETFISNKGEFIEGGLYTQLFYKHIMFRKSCGICYFTNLKRPSDITLADFWGWENSVPDMNVDDKGISLILLNTEKGKIFFNLARQCMDVKEVDIHNCLQRTLLSPSQTHSLRDKFEKDYIKYGFDSLISKYVCPSFLRKVVNKIKYGRASL